MRRTRDTRVHRAILLLALVGAGLAGCGGGDPASTRSEATTTTTVPAEAVVVTQVARFANTLTGLVGSLDGTEILVSDRLGLVWRLRTDPTHPDALPTLDPTPALDLVDRVSADPGERGFFGLAMSPDGSSIVVDYTGADGTIRVEQYPYAPGRPIDPHSARTLFELSDPYAWHHGGGLAFDRAGNLYVGIGDLEFRQIDPPGPQDPTLMLGSVLRIRAAVIADPTAVSAPTPADLVARGLRNPWRLSVDPDTDVLWIGEVGLDTFEEIDTIDLSTLRDGHPVNFGWPYYEGTERQQGTPPVGVDMVAPAFARHHQEGTCGMVGGYRYRGTRLTDLRGAYLYGDLCGPALRALTVHRDQQVDGDRSVAELPETIVSLGEQADGELWALGSTGGLYRLGPAGSPAASSTQSPPDQVTTTTIARTESDCSGGVVEAVTPLTDAGSMDGETLAATLRAVNHRMADVVPRLPSSIAEDGLLVQRVLLALESRLDAAGDDTEAAFAPIRADFLAGRGEFAGYPEAMARIVDSECG